MTLVEYNVKTRIGVPRCDPAGIIQTIMRRRTTGGPATLRFRHRFAEYHSSDQTEIENRKRNLRIVNFNRPGQIENLPLSCGSA